MKRRALITISLTTLMLFLGVFSSPTRADITTPIDPGPGGGGPLDNYCYYNYILEDCWFWGGGSVCYGTNKTDYACMY